MLLVWSVYLGQSAICVVCDAYHDGFEHQQYVYTLEHEIRKMYSMIIVFVPSVRVRDSFAERAPPRTEQYKNSS